MPVDLSNRPFSGRRIALLDDTSDCAAVVSNDSTIAVRIIELGGQHRRASVRVPMVLEQQAQRLRTQQLNVGIEQQQRPGCTREQRRRLQERMPCSKLL